ncbi:MAG: lipid-A-disaccharide synthase [Paludibacteraceae bacterium]|nr:lipid-A-disaccharide synthase [Paludibacteraceae bacterium]
MKYFIIAGEASGDLHASNLMASIKKNDGSAEFRFLGGDLMSAQGGEMVKHYKEMAFMGIITVLLHARTVLANIKQCKQAILDYQPDVLILVDYPSFNLKMAQFVKENMPSVPVYYYISPKLWAWKEYRLKSIRKYVDKVFSILPFEVKWFGERGYTVEYVGNPCVDAVEARRHKDEPREAFEARTGVAGKPIIGLLAGSRVQEIRSSLPIMLEAASYYKDYQMVVAGVKSVDPSVYEPILKNYDAKIIYDETYELLQQSEMAIVCSGTATLETALLRVPQVVVYMISGGWLVHRFLELFIRVPYISLVNLIADKWVVKELVSENFTVQKVREEIDKLRAGNHREQMLRDYDELIELLGHESASDRAANAMWEAINEMVVARKNA